THSLVSFSLGAPSTVVLNSTFVNSTRLVITIVSTGNASATDWLFSGSGITVSATSLIRDLLDLSILGTSSRLILSLGNMLFYLIIISVNFFFFAFSLTNLSPFAFCFCLFVCLFFLSLQDACTPLPCFAGTCILGAFGNTSCDCPLGTSGLLCS